MDINDFYKTVEKIVLFPGSLEELNGQEELNSQSNLYGFLPTKNTIRFLGGIILPSREMRNLWDLKTWDKVYKYDHFQDLDIRVKLKRMDADGIVRLQYMGNTTIPFFNNTFEKINLETYMGIPVKIVGKK